MIAFLDALLRHGFLQHALAAGLLASVACGVVGSYVVVMRLGYLAGGIAHSVLGGMGAAYFFGASPMAGAFAAAVLAALIIGLVRLRGHEHEDTIIGALWAVGMAVGVLFISRTPGYSVDLTSYLFGNILMVSRADLYLLAAVDVAALVLAVTLRKQLLAVAFDAEHAGLRGVPVTAVYLLLLCLAAVTVVAAIRLVGLILVIALLTLPAAIARQYTRSLLTMMPLAVLLGAGLTAGGLAAAYGPDLPVGPTIVLLTAAVYLLSTLGRATWLRRPGAASRGG